jgi:hypothetical protein
MINYVDYECNFRLSAINTRLSRTPNSNGQAKDQDETPPPRGLSTPP